MKRQPTEWKEIFANDVTDKWSKSKIYTQFIKLNIKNQSNQKISRI